jgi:beta-N-acetylhexosaminidase
MVAHATYPKVFPKEAGVPASLSKKWMGDVLRKKIGYRGLVISDDLEMGGVLAAASMEEAALRSIRAGADMLLVCQKEEFVWRSYEALLQEAERDRRFADVVTRAADRVLRFKQSSTPVRNTTLRQPAEQSIEALRKKLRDFTEEIERKSAATA